MLNSSEVYNVSQVACECIENILFEMISTPTPSFRNRIGTRKPEQVALIIDLINMAVDAVLPDETEKGVRGEGLPDEPKDDYVKIINLSALSSEQIRELIKRKMEGK